MPLVQNLTPTGLDLRGPVVKVEWVNPHAWIHMEHTTDAGEKKFGWSKAARRIRSATG